jgi:hypothetical protein
MMKDKKENGDTAIHIVRSPSRNEVFRGRMRSIRDLDDDIAALLESSTYHGATQLTVNLHVSGIPET